MKVICDLAILFLKMHVNLELSQNNVKSKISIYSISSYFLKYFNSYNIYNKDKIN